MENENRGGSRPGSGRPVGAITTGAGDPKNKFQIRLENEASRWVHSQGGNAFVKELALKAFREAFPVPLSFRLCPAGTTEEFAYTTDSEEDAKDWAHQKMKAESFNDGYLVQDLPNGKHRLICAY